MSRHEVEVRAEWRTVDSFEFDTEEEAEKFTEIVNAGGGPGLDAIVAAGDITSANAELVDWHAS